MDPVLAAMEAEWARSSGRFAAYDLVTPGSPGFVCLVQECTAHCCRKFSVSLGDRELERLRRFSALEPVAFLESEGGQPVVLPLAQPYLLGRRDGHCTLLGDDLACTQYHGRPDACRLYPHFIITIDRESGRPVWGDSDGIQRAVRSALAGEVDAQLTPMLLRHRECPGFSGEPVSSESWADLLAATCALQYPAGEPWAGASLEPAV